MIIFRNYTFVYEDLTLAELSERALELTIWDHDRLASNEFLGGVRFSLGTGKDFDKNYEGKIQLNAKMLFLTAFCLILINNTLNHNVTLVSLVCYWILSNESCYFEVVFNAFHLNKSIKR
jgi:C2 domain